MARARHTGRMRATPTTAFGLSCIRLDSDGATALVALHGGQLLSWVPADGRERLFLSERAVFDGSAPIRGGIPVVFPQFGERGALRKHGFARDRVWTFDGQIAEAAVFSLVGHGTDADWPYPFRLHLHVGLSADRLVLGLEAENTGAMPLAFAAALHTYLRVEDIARVAIEGLQGCDFEDSAAGGTLHRQHDYDVAFADDALDAGIDRIYGDVVAPLVVVEGERRLALAQDGFGDVVVWNPGAHLGAQIRDLAPDDWRRFVCIEAAQVLQPVVLTPGGAWRGSQVLGP